MSNATVTNFPGWAQDGGAQLLAGDVNGDQKTDLLLTGASGWSTLPVALSNGSGTFSVTNNSSTLAAWSQASGAKAIVGDFNHDTYFDAAAVGGTPWWRFPIAVSAGNGTFSFTNKLCP